MVDCQIRNLDKGFGAEVVGLDPTREIDAETRAALRQAFDERIARVRAGGMVAIVDGIVEPE